ncbi:MAG: metallophosphoesterase [Phycisphaerales bacterium JB059]
MPPIDLNDPDRVVAAFRAGASANREAACRQGSIDVISAPGRLIATGDLHDNPIHFAKLVEAAGLRDEDPESGRAHLTLHEIIHPERLLNGIDFSYRALTRVAALKAAHPEFVHTLLANHELAQVLGSGIVKNGVRVVEAFNEGLEYVFAEESERVAAAIADFVRSMPLALRVHTPFGDILCAHSLPGPAMMGRFDPSVLLRDLTEEDYEPRRGSAHLMIWGRGYDAEQLEDLVERWGVNLFILGHEHAPQGAMLVEPNALVLSSDHERGVYLPIDLEHPPAVRDCVGLVVPLSD